MKNCGWKKPQLLQSCCNSVPADTLSVIRRGGDSLGLPWPRFSLIHEKPRYNMMQLYGIMANKIVSLTENQIKKLMNKQYPYRHSQFMYMVIFGRNHCYLCTGDSTGQKALLCIYPCIYISGASMSQINIHVEYLYNNRRVLLRNLHYCGPAYLNLECILSFSQG